MGRRTRLILETLEGKELLSGATSGLVASIVAAPTVTAGVTTVALTFTETNVSNHVIEVTRGAINTGFSASQNGKTAWVSNTGFLPQYLMLEGLKPGQSITINGTWDGHSNSGIESGPTEEGPALTGTFTIANQLDSHATTQVTLGFRPTDVVPPKPPHLVH